MVHRPGLALSTRRGHGLQGKARHPGRCTVRGHCSTLRPGHQPSFPGQVPCNRHKSGARDLEHVETKYSTGPASTCRNALGAPDGAAQQLSLALSAKRFGSRTVVRSSNVPVGTYTHLFHRSWCHGSNLWARLHPPQQGSHQLAQRPQLTWTSPMRTCPWLRMTLIQTRPSLLQRERTAFWTSLAMHPVRRALGKLQRIRCQFLPARQWGRTRLLTKLVIKARWAPESSGDDGAPRTTSG